MSTISDQIGQALLRLLANSKLPSELQKIWRALKPMGFVVQSGTSDAEYIQISELRGYLGSYNASNNLITLGDGSTLSMPNNLNAVAGEWVTVSTGGTRDFGSGAITVVAGDRLRYDGLVWYKESGTDFEMIIPEDGQLIAKRDGKTEGYLQTGDLVSWKKVLLNGNEVTIIGAKYLGPDEGLYTSYAPGLHIWIDGQRFNYVVGLGNDGSSLQVGDIAANGTFTYNGSNFLGDLRCTNILADTTTGIGTTWEIINRTQI